MERDAGTHTNKKKETIVKDKQGHQQQTHTSSTGTDHDQNTGKTGTKNKAEHNHKTNRQDRTEYTTTVKGATGECTTGMRGNPHTAKGATNKAPGQHPIDFKENK